MTASSARRPGALARIVLTSLAVMLLLVPTAPAFVTTAAPDAEAGRDPRFGLNEAWRIGEKANEAGAGWSRILFWWSEMQKGGPGDLDLFATDQDRFILEEVGRGRQLAGTVLNVPGWASSDGSRNGVPKNLHLPYDHPDNYWGQFMRKMAEHYRGKVDTWIIWNEVDVPHGQWNTWHGSIEEYAQLQKVSYRAIKAGNPNATVLPFGAAWWYDKGATLTRLLDALASDPEAAAHNYYFDAANLHLYSRADDIPRIVGWYREQMAMRGMSKPIWIGETNAVPYDDAVWPAAKANFRATLDEQASYIIQSFATYIGLGIERIGVNRAIDGTDFEAGGEPFGLLRNDGSARPAFTAYQVATRHFANVEDATYFPADEGGVTRVVLKKAGERVTVIWTMQPATVGASVAAVAPSALKVNKFGETETIQAKDGAYSLMLAPATANSNEHDRRDYVVGGDPVILVERTDGGSAVATDAPGEAVAAEPAAEAGRALAATATPRERKPTATPTPQPKKATPTPTPKKK